MNRSTISISSTWTKGKLICHVHSHRDNSKVSMFKFSGHNPFPCYEMRSTFGVVRQWLEDNGWKREVGGKVILQNFTVSDETGDLLSSENHTYHYIPVAKKSVESDKDKIDLAEKFEEQFKIDVTVDKQWKSEAKKGNFEKAIDLYCETTGRSFKEGKLAVALYVAKNS